MKRDRCSRWPGAWVFSLGWSLIVVLVLFTGSSWGGKWKADTDPTVVKTKFGVVKGYVDEGTGTIVWKGIPYARPPVGELRWMPPVDPLAWDGTLNADNDPTACAQMGHDPLTWAPTEPIGSEDCLYLNIWRPNNGKRRLPVYVWIHGGSNNYGAAEDYNGGALASLGDMVVVVIQYRLNVFGWLTHPALWMEGDEGVSGYGKSHGKWRRHRGLRLLAKLINSGNFGTLDTIQALRWVRRNIRAFGGDPRRVTIGGESAGAHNVVNLYISPLARRLFHRAVSESGGMKLWSIEQGVARAQELLGKLLEADGLGGVPDMDGDGDSDDVDTNLYLRSKTTEQLVKAYWAGSHPASSAYMDGFVIPVTEGGVLAAIEAGRFNRVPIVLGANKDEMKFFLPLYGPYVKWIFNIPSESDHSWLDLLTGVLGDGLALDDVLPGDYNKAIYQNCASFGSLNWRYNFVDLIARPLRERWPFVWAYDFRWDGQEGSDYQFILGAAHATEIPFFFGGDTDIYGGFAFSPGNDTAGRQALSMAMMQYLANFARRGNPNGWGLPWWRRWSNRPDGPKRIVFDATEENYDISMTDEEIAPEDIEDLYNGFDDLTKSLIDTLFRWY